MKAAQRGKAGRSKLLQEAAGCGARRQRTVNCGMQRSIFKETEADKATAGGKNFFCQYKFPFDNPLLKT